MKQGKVGHQGSAAAVAVVRQWCGGDVTVKQVTTRSVQVLGKRCSVGVGRGDGDGHPAGPPGSVAADSCKLVAPRTTPEGENARSLTFFRACFLVWRIWVRFCGGAVALLLVVVKVSVGIGDTPARQAPCVCDAAPSRLRSVP